MAGFEYDLPEQDLAPPVPDPQAQTSATIGAVMAMQQENHRYRVEQAYGVLREAERIRQDPELMRAMRDFINAELETLMVIRGEIS